MSKIAVIWFANLVTFKNYTYLSFQTEGYEAQQQCHLAIVLVNFGNLMHRDLMARLYRFIRFLFILLKTLNVSTILRISMSEGMEFKIH